MSNRVKGRFARAGRKVNAADTAPQFGSDSPELIVAPITEPLPKRALRGTVTLVLAVVFSAVLFYLVLASTVLGVFGTGGRHAVVLRAAFPQGAAPPGSIVFASSSEAPHDFQGKITQAFRGVPNGSVIEIVARPGLRVANGPGGMIYAGGTATGYTATVKPRLLVRQYLAICVSGACGQPGDPVLVPQDNLVGSVKGYVGLLSFERPQAAGR